MKDEALNLALEGAANYIDALGGDSRKYRQALAAPVQEPVAWRYDLKHAGSFAGVSREYSPIKLSIGENWTPLYTTPPAAQRQWVGLSDEDIEQEFGFIDELLRDCVHRTEAKLKEKNT